MKHDYRVTETVESIENGITALTYGIAVYTENGSSPKLTVNNVFTSRKTAVSFAKLCNSLELAPEHLSDAIYDALTAI